MSNYEAGYKRAGIASIEAKFVLNSRSLTGWQLFWHRYRKSPAAIVGLVLTAFYIVLSLFAHQIASADPFDTVGVQFQSPSSTYWFGTDNLGRDVFSGVVYGARTSLIVGFTVAGVSFVIGVLIGSVAGFFGTTVDDLLMRMTELVIILPRFFLALVVVALFGSSLTNLIFVLALTNWGFTARLTRAGVLSAKETEYVVSARSLGMRNWSILFLHILPNAIAPVIVHAFLQVGRSILIEASLSFIGLGDPNTISWGYMLNNAQSFIRRAWWVSVFPGFATALLILGVNLLGDGLNDALNPRFHRR